MTEPKGVAVSDTAESLKRAAAVEAIKCVDNGMAVGLGTGSTARLMIEALGERVRREGLKIRAIPTSKASEQLAAEMGIPRTNFVDDPCLDVAIDGADEVQLGTLFLIKGRGGALLREKIVAKSARKFVVIVDESKLVTDLGNQQPLPVEVVPWGWERVAKILQTLGAQKIEVRRTREDTLFKTDNHNMILDTSFAGIQVPNLLADEIKSIAGVVDHGLFLNLPLEVIVARPSGVSRLMGPS